MKNVIIYVCLLMLLVSSIFAPIHTIEAKAAAATMEKNYGVIEAEDCTLSSNTSKVFDLKASKMLAVKFVPKSSSTTVENSDSTPTLSAEFNIETAGTYVMWMRVKCADENSNSVFYAYNCPDYTAKHISAKEDWQWINLGGIPLGKGEAFFSLKYREKNFMIDRLLITTDLAFVPVGAQDVPDISDTDSNLFPIPEIQPISGHPRVFLTPEYIGKLKEYILTDEIAPAWSVVKTTAEKNRNSELAQNVDDNFDYGLINWVQCRALVYALGEKDDNWAKDTIEHAKNVLRTVIFSETKSDVTREKGLVMVMGAVVYDWCYDLMTEDDKTYFIKRFKEICASKEIGYPPKSDICATGSHTGEYEIHRDMLACGIACYDEDPEMYNLGAGALFSRYVKSRKLFNESANHPQGSAYGLIRHGCEMYAELLFRRMGYTSVYGEEIESVIKRYIYARRPDGMILKDNDDYTFRSRSAVLNYSTEDWYSLIFLNALYDDPYVRGQFMKELSIKRYSSDAFYLVICADPGKPFKYTDDLPTAYKTSYPLTSVFHRTGWQAGLDSDAAMAQFKAYERNIGDHMHLDTGTFQLYYKGALAIDSGYYELWGNAHDFNYDKRTVAHNLVTVYDPNEKFVAYDGKEYANDGGQRFNKQIVAKDFEYMMSEECHYADTKGTYIGPEEKTPAFSYLKTDITPSYSDKVQSYNRSMVFMDLFDEDYPAAFIVYDNVTSSDKTFDKKWLLHSIEEPVISENTTTISRTEDGYNGKLVNKTFLPSSFSIAKVGGDGKEFLVDGINYPVTGRSPDYSEKGSWRIELSPKKESENDIFLNAMYVTDNDKSLPELAMHKESMNGFVGVTVKDRFVLFSENADTKTENFSIDVRNNGYDEVICFIGDIKEGVWNISGNGISINVESKKTEKVLCFKVQPGSYVISKTNNSASSFEWEDTPKAKSGDFIVYNRSAGGYIRNSYENKLINGIAYVEAETTFEQLGAKVQHDNTNGCIVITKDGNIARIYGGSSSYVLNGAEMPLSSTVVTENGNMYVPVCDFNKLLNLNIVYDSTTCILNVSNLSDSDSTITLNAEGNVSAYPVGTKIKINVSSVNLSGKNLNFYNNGELVCKESINCESVYIPLKSGQNNIYASCDIPALGTIQSNVVAKTGYDACAVEGIYVSDIGVISGQTNVKLENPKNTDCVVWAFAVGYSNDKLVEIQKKDAVFTKNIFSKDVAFDDFGSDTTDIKLIITTDNMKPLSIVHYLK